MKTNKIIMWVIVALVVIIGVVFFTNSKSTQEGSAEDKKNDQVNTSGEKVPDLSNDNGFAPKDGRGGGIPTTNINVSAGSYEAYSPEKIAQKSATGNVVLFFHASWCPICRAIEQDINANLNKIPKNLTILKVDFDTEKALEKEYGVTQQYTFVQVDKNGKKLNMWLGAGDPTLAGIVSHI